MNQNNESCKGRKRKGNDLLEDRTGVAKSKKKSRLSRRLQLKNCHGNLS